MTKSTFERFKPHAFVCPKPRFGPALRRANGVWGSPHGLVFDLVFDLVFSLLDTIETTHGEKNDLTLTATRL